MECVIDKAIIVEFSDDNGTPIDWLKISINWELILKIQETTSLEILESILSLLV